MLRVALVIGVCLLPFLNVAADAADIAIVVHPQVPVDNVTFAALRTLMMGDQQYWQPNNIRVTLLIRAPVAREREVILSKIYRMNEAQFRQYWIGKVFRAEASAGPKIVYSNDMAASLVSSIPGSVAFVDAAQIPKGLKVLKIDGKAPGDQGYPLN